jgi:hypothetical protein
MKIITQNHIAEFLALLMSLIYFKTLQKGRLKTLPFFLGFILCVELAGSYLRRILHTNNTWLYNASIPVEYGYYLFLFWLHAQSRLKKFLIAAIPLFFLVVIWGFCTMPMKIFHSNALVAGQVLVILSCCIYIYELFKSSEEESLFRNYFYWLVSGLLLFNLGDSVYFILYPTIHQQKWDRFDTLFKSINNNLLLLLYLSYIISILAFKKYQQPTHAGND